MRKLLVLASLAAIAMTGIEVQASQRRPRPQVAVPQGQGPVNRLIELERRKNAALRQMFFGR